MVSSNAQEQTGTLADILALAEEQQVQIERLDRRQLDQKLHNINHQGVALEANDYPYSDIEDMLALARQRNQMPLLLMLDHLQDPQNLGTLLRTAEIVGVHGVIIPGRRAAEITPAVVNASSGAVEHLLISVVTNLSQSIERLQKQGVWVVGVEDDAKSQYYDQTDLNMPLALVLGSEGSGMARLTRERCDFLVKLPMEGQIHSLNVAVAGSVVLYQALRDRRAAASA
jgi:23S rRNA (guanosine2251-2'-O)-methyltransferase